MEYKHYVPVDAPADEGPTKAAILMQIEADHEQAKKSSDTDLMKLLDARHKAVSAARSDEAARAKYAEAIAEQNAPAPEDS